MILAQFRSKRKVALAVASSGIAAILLKGARTGHSRFNKPFVLRENSTCNISLQSEDAALIQNTELILWDEFPMMNRFAFETSYVTLWAVLILLTVLSLSETK